MNKNDGYIILESSYSSVPEIVSDKCDVTVFKAIIQEAELPNRNKRIYSKKALMEALARPMVQEKLRNKNFYGESGHPMEETIQRQTYIDQRNISHIITNLEWEGNLLKATIETANTQAGRDFQGLIRQGSKVSFSMRGVGGQTKKKDGYDFIDGGLHILTYDWVVFPSHEKAYMEEIIKENAEFDVNYTNSSKVLTEGHTIPFDMGEVKEVLDEQGIAFTIRNIGPILSNMSKRAIHTGNFKGLRKNLLKMVKSCKNLDELNYLSKDISRGIPYLRNIAKSKPEMAKEIEEHIKWLQTEYKQAINEKRNQLKTKKEDINSIGFKESCNMLELFMEDSIRVGLDNFLINL